MINLAIDIIDDHLRAKHIQERRIPPDLTDEIQGQRVQVWLDVSGVALEEIEDLVWVTVIAALK